MTRKLLIAIFAVILTASPAFAGALNGHAGAFNDGSITWTGSAPFSNAFGVSGYVDWTVFGPGGFPYSPSFAVGPDELVFAYQVFNTGTVTIASFAVSLVGPAVDMGSFSDLSGEAVINTVLIPGSKARWEFDGISPEQASEGLALSSTHLPQLLFGFPVGGGTFAVAMDIPSPSGTPTPEPTSLVLIAAGGLSLLRARKR